MRAEKVAIVHSQKPCAGIQRVNSRRWCLKLLRHYLKREKTTSADAPLLDIFTAIIDLYHVITSRVAKVPSAACCRAVIQLRLR